MCCTCCTPNRLRRWRAAPGWADCSTAPLIAASASAAAIRASPPRPSRRSSISSPLCWTSRPAGEPAEMVIQTPHWYQHLKFAPAELSALCDPLVRRAIAETQDFLTSIAALGPVGAVLLTGPAGRLPGLVAALDSSHPSPGVRGVRRRGQPRLRRRPGRGHTSCRPAFTSSMTTPWPAPPSSWRCGSTGASCRAAISTPCRCRAAPVPTRPTIGVRRGCTTAARTICCPVPCSRLAAIRPATWSSRRELYPSVSARHCEIAFTRGVYLLRDRSRHGTLRQRLPGDAADRPALRRLDSPRTRRPAGPLPRHSPATSADLDDDRLTPRISHARPPSHPLDFQPVHGGRALLRPGLRHSAVAASICARPSTTKRAPRNRTVRSRSAWPAPRRTR